MINSAYPFFIWTGLNGNENWRYINNKRINCMIVCICCNLHPNCTFFGPEQTRPDHCYYEYVYIAGKINFSNLILIPDLTLIKLFCWSTSFYKTNLTGVIHAYQKPTKFIFFLFSQQQVQTTEPVLFCYLVVAFVR